MEQLVRLRGFGMAMLVLLQLMWLRPYVSRWLLDTGAAFQLFFLIAGYLVADQLLSRDEQRPSFWRVYGERARRLVPPLLLWLGVANLCAHYWNSSGAFGRENTLLRDTAGVLSLSYNLLKSHGFNQEGTLYWNVLGTYWHVTFEEQYFILVAMLTLWLVRGHRARQILFLALSLIAALILMRIPFGGPPEKVKYFYRFSFLHNLTPFFLGTLAHLAGARWLSSLRLLQWVGAHRWVTAFLALLAVYYPSLAIWAMTSPTGATDWSRWPNVAPLLLLPYWLVLSLLIAVCASERSGVLFAASWSKRVFGYLGSRFYGIYLGHVIVIRFVEELSFRITGLRMVDGNLSLAHALTNTALALGLAVGLGEVVHRTCERLFQPTAVPQAALGARTS
jgi:peptidoglycan/LPS O-acetylase OafA/YrhL